jgi:hypothetical protein|tara:strand:+ start:1046 stop:1684 length:639 start_codon:yes stop_codon:yes gene_type:complete
MSNPKSPHAAANKGGWKPKIMRDGKPVQDGQEVMGVAKVVTPPKKVTVPGLTQTQSPKSPSNKVKTSLSKQDSKKAVQMIFNSRWWGWENGLPPQFPELFKQFGKYISASVQPSQMVGNPQSHRSQINIRGIAPYVLIMDIILPQERMSGVERKLTNSPIHIEKRGIVSVPDMIIAIENDGKTFDFEKVDEDTYKYEDANGQEHQLPRWAIA